MAQKYYHASPKRFKIGTILSNPGVHKQNYNASADGIYITTSPYPHFTIDADFDKLNIYEVLPLTKIYRGGWNDLITDQVKIIKFIGNASKFSKTGLSSKSSSVEKHGYTRLYNKKLKSRYTLTILSERYRNQIFGFGDRDIIRRVWSDDLNKINKYIEKKKPEFYILFDNLKKITMEDTTKK